MGPLWEPSEERIKNANITAYIDFVNQQYSLDIRDYQGLYDWSIANREISGARSGISEALLLPSRTIRSWKTPQP